MAYLSSLDPIILPVCNFVPFALHFRMLVTSEAILRNYHVLIVDWKNGWHYKEFWLLLVNLRVKIGLPNMNHPYFYHGISIKHVQHMYAPSMLI